MDNTNISFQNYPKINRRKKQISFEILKELSLIFDHQKWLTDSQEGELLLNRFCEMLGFFTIEQQKCLINLTRKFLRIELYEYSSHIRRCLEKIDSKVLDPIKRVFILPINDENGYKEAGNSSGWLVASLFYNSTFTFTTTLKDKELRIINHPKKINLDFDTNQSMLLLVDDFIGSGGKLNGCIEYLNDLKININKAVILTIVIQNEGLQRSRFLGIPIIFSILRYKGISDEYEEPDRGIYLSIMMSIERYLNIKEKWIFGHMQSEALVKMNRTPNNTFPVFWQEPKLRDGRKFIAPFPRYLNSRNE